MRLLVFVLLASFQLLAEEAPRPGDEINLAPFGHARVWDGNPGIEWDEPREILRVEQGSLYPALHRLIKRGWISAEEGTSENNRRAKYYRLTAKGRKQLVVETTKWDILARAIGRILRPSRQENSL